MARRKRLREWTSALGPTATARDVLELAFYGVSALGYQTYYDESDRQAEVIDLPSLVVIGRQSGRGDYAEFLDRTLVYLQPVGEGSWLTFEDHPSRRQASPLAQLDSLEAVADVIERAAERADDAIAADEVPAAVVTDEEFRLRQLALDASAMDIAMTVADDPSSVKAVTYGTGIDIALADGTRLSIGDPTGGWRKPVWEIRHDSPHLYERPPSATVSSVEEVVGAIKHAQEDAAVRVRSGRLPVQLVTPFEFEVRQRTEEVPASAIGAIAVDELTDNAFGLTLHAAAMTGEDSCLVEVRDAEDQAQERMLISSPRASATGGWTLQTTNLRTGAPAVHRAETLPELARTIAGVWRAVADDHDPHGAVHLADLPPAFVESTRRMSAALDDGHLADPAPAVDPDSEQPGSMESGPEQQ